MRVLAVFNIKGGVGKTATAVNLSSVAARAGARVLLWDLDPQGAATYYFRIAPKIKGGGKGLVLGRSALDALIKGTDCANLDLVPADFSYRHMDLLLSDFKKPTRRIRKLLKAVADDYDFVFLDCPPGISLLSENVLQAAQNLLVPVIPTTLSARTLEQLEKFCRKEGLTHLELLPFFSMVDRRKRMHADLVERLAAAHPAMLASAIPDSADVERMGVHRAPVWGFAPNSRASGAYETLWREVLLRISEEARIERGSSPRPEP